MLVRSEISSSAVQRIHLGDLLFLPSRECRLLKSRSLRPLKIGIHSARHLSIRSKFVLDEFLTALVAYHRNHATIQRSGLWRHLNRADGRYWTRASAIRPWTVAPQTARLGAFVCIGIRLTKRSNEAFKRGDVTSSVREPWNVTKARCHDVVKTGRTCWGQWTARTRRRMT